MDYTLQEAFEATLLFVCYSERNKDPQCMAVHSHLWFMINATNQQIKSWDKPQTCLHGVLGKLKVCLEQQTVVNCQCYTRDQFLDVLPKLVCVLDVVLQNTTAGCKERRGPYLLQ